MNEYTAHFMHRRHARPVYENLIRAASLCEAIKLAEQRTLRDFIMVGVKSTPRQPTGDGV